MTRIHRPSPVPYPAQNARYRTWRALPCIVAALCLALLTGCTERGSNPSSTSDASELMAQAVAPGVFSAHHAAMSMRTTFAAGRVALVASRDDARPAAAVELQAVAWGCEGALQALAPVVPSATEHGGIEYRRADFDEWYAPGPEGLEQGFTIRRLPECTEQGAPLIIQLGFQDAPGFHGEPNADGSEALLNAPGGRVVHYGQASARDALGTARTVRIVSQGGLSLEVSASNAALPLLIDPVAWVEQQKLLAGDGAAADSFGSAVAISGDTALVGAASDDHLGVDAGSAYVFVRGATGWTLQQKLTPADGAAGDLFGCAVALSGNTALVGAYGDDDAFSSSGSAYVFVRTGSTWTQQAKLVAGDPAANDHFGYSVALSGDNAVVGAPLKDNTGTDAGAAYAFLRSGTTWSQQGTRLSPSSTALDHQGSAVAIANNSIAIGTDRLNGYTLSFYAFSSPNWVLASSGNLSSTDPAVAHFASALAMSGTFTVLGGYASDAASAASIGSVLVLANPAHSASYTLKASDGQIGDQFGTSVATAGSMVLVGSPGDDDKGTDSGSAYVFTFNGTAFNPPQKLTAAAGLAGDHFGAAVALDSYQLIGAPLRDDGASNAGAAYTEGYGASNGTVCTQNSECGSGFCVEGVCCNNACTSGCQACTLKNKGSGADGTCGNIKVGTDPKDSCPTSVDSCGTSGVCDGKGACAIPALGASCTFTTCAGPKSAVLNSICDGAGKCVPTATIDCQLGYECVAGNCKSGCSLDTDCDAALGFVCAAGGFCLKPKGSTCTSNATCSTGACQYGTCCLPNSDGACIKPLGIACTAASECASAACVDGVCCNSACAGNCESCAVPASPGTCSPIFSGTCAPPDGGTSVGGASAGGASAGGASGFAGFAEGGSISGAGFATGGASQAGFGQAGVDPGGGSSNAGQDNANGGTAGHAGHAGNAGTTALGPGECANDGMCAEASVCDSATHTCVDRSVAACGCRVVGAREAPSAYLALLGMLVLGGARRRRRGTVRPWPQHRA